MRLTMALINLKDGWSDHQDFSRLADVFADVGEPPALIAVNEAFEWDRDGGRTGLAAANALALLYDRPYQVRVGWCARSGHPPALVWDPTCVTLEWWGDQVSTRALFKRNTALMRTRQGTGLQVVLQHWHPFDGDHRLHQARTISWAADPGVPAIVGGDLNSTASGAHLPEKDWHRTPPHTRHHKGWQPQGPGTRWRPDTRAVDHLIGSWDSGRGHRVGGAGFHSLAELDWWQRGAPDELLAPTTNTPPERGGSMLIDWLLVNEPLAGGLVPGSYRVHLPRPGLQHTDHRLVTAALDV